MDAEYAQTEEDRRVLAERARAYEAQAREIEESLDGWRL
jgi:hypothetical protein